MVWNSVGLPLHVSLNESPSEKEGKYRAGAVFVSDGGPQ